MALETSSITSARSALADRQAQFIIDNAVDFAIVGLDCESASKRDPGSTGLKHL